MCHITKTERMKMKQTQLASKYGAKIFCIASLAISCLIASPACLRSVLVFGRKDKNDHKSNFIWMVAKLPTGCLITMKRCHVCIR